MVKVVRIYKKYRQAGSPRGEAGLTLIELMITTVILIVALCGILLLYNFCYTRSIESTNRITATAEAYGTLEEIRAHNFTSIMADYNGMVFTVPQLSGTKTSAITYVPGTGSQLLEASVTVNWLDKQNRNEALTLTTMVANK